VKRQLPLAEAALGERQLALHEALDELGAVRLDLDETLLANVNTPDELRRLG